MLNSIRTFVFFSAIVSFVAVAHAGKADVVDATIRALGGESFRINATLVHADTGWDHYADAWDVLDESGNVLGTRILHHPHVEEQPFTRSLKLNIPVIVKRVFIRARDSRHEYGGEVFELDVPHS
ncbi:MAG: hypothetical protein AAF434_01690 [Pseudomonadota bacterium]